MKDRYTRSDCNKLRELIIQDCKNMASNGNPNYIMLSGGMDSITVLYGFMAAGIPFKAINFKLKNIESKDTNSVKSLHKKAGFDCSFIEIESDPEYIMKKLPNCVSFCKEIFGRVRKVKVETIYMLSECKKHIPAGSNVYFSRGDIICGYLTNLAILAAHKGDEHKDVIAERLGKDIEHAETARVFCEPDYSYRGLFNGDLSQNFLINFKIGAINKGFPKSMLYYAFEDYHKKYNSYRKPIGFHKGSKAVDLFENIAKNKGYKDALQMFNMIARRVADANG